MNPDSSVLQYGSPLEQARTAVVLVHGRGGTAQGMLPLAEDLQAAQPGERTAFLMPQAPGNTWYPYSFLAPIDQNEPHLSQALAVLGSLLAQIEAAGLTAAQVLLAGFSQGACLASEYAARNARRYGGLAALSGGLIGPAGTPRDYPASLDGTPVFLGCSDIDPHIPKWRVEETADVLGLLGAVVTTRFYPDMGHTINEDELAFVREMVRGLYA